MQNTKALEHGTKSSTTDIHIRVRRKEAEFTAKQCLPSLKGRYINKVQRGYFV